MTAESVELIGSTPGGSFAAPRSAGQSLARLAYIDNVRWVMIVLVLSMHAADTYSPFGNWYYTERPTLGLTSIAFFSFYQSFLQAFFMALLYFIAGYFTPRSYDRKGPLRFLYDRFIRLGLPTLLYMLVIGPLTEYYVSHTWRTHDSFARAWWGHITDGEVFGMTGPMWFCAALLIFCVFYMAFRLLASTVGLRLTYKAGVNNRNLVLLIAVIALTTFGVKIANPTGASFYNMQINDFPSYIIFFVVGIYAWRCDLLTHLSRGFGLRWGAIGLGIAFVLWPALVVFGGALHGDTQSYSGGLHWQNLGMCIWAASICVCISLGLTVWFREHFNVQGPVSRFMSANAFAVYVFHPPMLIGLALVLSSFAAPGVMKFVLLTALAVVVNFAAADRLFRRIPLLKRIL